MLGKKVQVIQNEDHYMDNLSTLIKLGPGEERVKAAVTMITDNDADPNAPIKSWMSEITPYLTFHSSTPKTATSNATVTFRFTSQPVHSNGTGNVHGGCISTLFDFCTSAVFGMVNRPGHWFFLGVSRSLNVTYLRPMPIGEEVLVESELLSAGRNLAHIKGRIRRVSDGTVLATCEHDKVNADPPAESKL